MRTVNEFKIEKAVNRIMDVMEKENLNVAEAEEIPKALKRKIKENGERKAKAIPFTIFRGIKEDL